MRSSWSILLAVLAGCSARSVVQSRESPIYWGDREDGYDGVVQLTISFSLLEGAACSGTLVSPRVVVTAQHCVEDQEGTPVAPGAIRVHTGPTGGGGDYGVEDVRSL